jgi:hypothetical protein
MDEVERDLQRLDCAKRTVHLVVDWRRASSYPFNYDMISRISQLLRHPKLGYIFVMGMNPVLSFWAELYTRLTGVKWQKVENINQAVESVTSMESSTHD